MDQNLVDDDQGLPPIAGEVNNLLGRYPPPGGVAPTQDTPTTQAGKIGTNSAKPPKNKPGKRLQNPLGNFSSYTYQISLYMITPDAYNAFIQSGRTDINAIKNLSPSAPQTLSSPPLDTAVDASDNRFARQGTPERSTDSSPVSPSSTLAKTRNVGGAYLIAQSGGINNSSSTRAPEFNLDFYIDNLKLLQAIGTPETQSSTNITEFSFDIVEPYGFSFVSRLKKASDALKSASSLPNYDQLDNPSRNLFVLGFQFLGYDEKGNLIDPNTISSTLGNPIGNASGIYQRFYDIKIKEFKYKIDGKSVTYNIKAASIPFDVSLSNKRGILWTGASITGATVNDALLGGSNILNSSADPTNAPDASDNRFSRQGSPSLGLITKLNNDEKARKDAGDIEIASEWDVKFLGEAASSIANATLKTNAKLDKRFWPQSSATTTAEVNPSKEQTGENANSPQPNNTSRQLSFPTGITILQIVDEIIKQSSYIEDALTAQIQTDLETDPISDDEDVQKNANPKTIKWYNIQAEVQNLGWDRKQSDFIYKTTYIIQTYSTPSVLSAYAGRTDQYPGPDKRYDYWFTGKNSEVIRFEQSLDNNYFNVTLGKNGDAETNPATGGTANIPVVVGQPQNQSKQGAINKGLEAQNSYMTSLFDPGSWAQVKLHILGDPDFLMQSAPSSLDKLYDLYYGTDGYSINPNGRQVFIELNFNEPYDYDNSDGLMNINRSIGITTYPASIQQQIDARGGGIVLQILTINSTFRSGKFEQELTCRIATFDETATPPAANGSDSSNAREGTTASSGTKVLAAPYNPNQTAATQARTKVPLNSNAGGGRGGRGGPTAEEVAVFGGSTNRTGTASTTNGITTNGGAFVGYRIPKINPLVIAKIPYQQNQTGTIPTKTGPVQDDDSGGNDGVF